MFCYWEQIIICLCTGNIGLHEDIMVLSIKDAWLWRSEKVLWQIDVASLYIASDTLASIDSESSPTLVCRQTMNCTNDDLLATGHLKTRQTSVKIESKYKKY